LRSAAGICFYFKLDRGEKMIYTTKRCGGWRWRLKQ